jgi:peptide/nickel transport system permease protein
VPRAERLARAASTLTTIARVVARRLPLYAFALWVALTVCYALPQLTSRAQSTRNPQPLSPGGYGHFLANVLRGHVDQGIPGLASVLLNSLPFSLLLVAAGVSLAFAVGVLLGMLAGWRRGGVVDSFATTASAAIWATPAFVLAGLAVYFLALELHWFATGSAYAVELTPRWTGQFALSVVRHVELPVLVLFVSSLGFWALTMRNVITSVANEEYIQLARVKGLTERRVMWRYGARNALLPVITSFAVAFGIAIGGIPVIEAIFNFQGGGWQLAQAAINANFPLMQGIFICIVAFAVVVNLVADVAQVMLDPRLR